LIQGKIREAALSAKTAETSGIIKPIAAAIYTFRSSAHQFLSAISYQTSESVYKDLLSDDLSAALSKIENLLVSESLFTIEGIGGINKMA
jgi:hypothetical protein